MPCKDYEDHYYRVGNSDETNKVREQNDRLARIACAAMTELEHNGIAEGILLRNDEVRTWWEAHKIADAKARAEKAKKEAAELEKRRLAKIKQELLNSMTPDQKKALGIK